MDKKINILKIVFISTMILMIIGFIYFIVIVLYGNPFTAISVENKIQKYVNTVYSPDSKIKTSHYDSKSSLYTFEINVDNLEYEFDYSSGRIFDARVDSYYKQKLDKDYSEFLKRFSDNKNLKLPEAEIDTSVVADGNYSSNMDDLYVVQRLYILRIENYDKTIINSDSIQMAGKITSQLLDQLKNQYNFKSVQVQYIDKSGLYEIAIEDKALTLEELLKNTRKCSEGQITTEDEQFINKLNQ